MKIIYSDNDNWNESYNNSIFLAGPTPRSKEVISWRPKAINILREMGFYGTVFYPEYEDIENMNKNIDYNSQVEWEYRHLENCTTIVFWVPRNLKTNPAFTTNVEFGRYCADPKIVYGRPDDAPNNKYLDWLYEKMGNGKPFNDLEKLIKSIDIKPPIILEYYKLTDLMKEIDLLSSKENYEIISSHCPKKMWIGFVSFKKDHEGNEIPDTARKHIIKISTIKYTNSKEEQSEFSSWIRQRGI